MSESMDDVFFEIHQGLSREAPGRNEYTRRAFRMLPTLDRPRILDIGCGPGGPTLELARLSHGEITGLDNHQPYLDELTGKIGKAGLSHRMSVVKGSMFDLPFPDESFDILWAEGSIYIIGFDRGLKEWRRLIEPGGFLVVHDVSWLHPDPPEEIVTYWKANDVAIRTVEENVERIPGYGYDLIGHFPLPEDAWWIEYYGPLEQRIKELRRRYVHDPEALAVLDREHEEIEMFRKYHHWYGSVFFVMQRGRADAKRATDRRGALP